MNSGTFGTSSATLSPGAMPRARRLAATPRSGPIELAVAQLESPAARSAGAVRLSKALVCRIDSQVEMHDVLLGSRWHA